MTAKQPRAYEHTFRSRARRLISRARSRAIAKGLAFAISIAVIEEKLAEGVCEVSGIPFYIGEGRSPFAPSLDRKDPNQGYTDENTQLVCFNYNTSKQEFTHADVMTMARALCAREDRECV